MSLIPGRLADIRSDRLHVRKRTMVARDFMKDFILVEVDSIEAARNCGGVLLVDKAASGNNKPFAAFFGVDVPKAEADVGLIRFSKSRKVFPTQTMGFRKSANASSARRYHNVGMLAGGDIAIKAGKAASYIYYGIATRAFGGVLWGNDYLGASDADLEVAVSLTSSANPSGSANFRVDTPAGDTFSMWHNSVSTTGVSGKFLAPSSGGVIWSAVGVPMKAKLTSTGLGALADACGFPSSVRAEVVDAWSRYLGSLGPLTAALVPIWFRKNGFSGPFDSVKTIGSGTTAKFANLYIEGAYFSVTVDSTARDDSPTDTEDALPHGDWATMSPEGTVHIIVAPTTNMSSHNFYAPPGAGTLASAVPASVKDGDTEFPGAAWFSPISPLLVGAGPTLNVGELLASSLRAGFVQSIKTSTEVDPALPPGPLDQLVMMAGMGGRNRQEGYKLPSVQARDGVGHVLRALNEIADAIIENKVEEVLG